MVQKKKRMAAGKKHLIGLIAVVGILSALWCQSLVSLADSNGTVTADSANIRKQADASSEVIGSASRGNTVAIINEVSDSSGTLWYEVYVNANTTGYIRSDLVEKQGGGTSQNASGDTQTTAQSGASGASVEPETILDAQYAVVSPEVIMVRTAPSTNEGVVDRLNKDAQVIVSGETQGNDGKKWYYVTFTGTGGAERSGFIRSDLLSLGDMVPVPEEEEPEPQETEPEPEPIVNKDYEVKYEPNIDGSGSYEYYLYDYTIGDGKRDKYRLADLMEATKARSESAAADAKTLVRQRVAIVILVVLVVILIIVGVIMALKLRDVYYEEYEDEEEEEEAPAQRKKRSEEETPAQRRRRSEEEEVPTQRKKRTERTDEISERRRRRAEEDEPTVRRRKRIEEDESEDERPVRRKAAREDRESRGREVEYHEDEAGSAAVKSASKRKAKNFLLDDDEFEFEFLNMDDKNL